MRGVVWTRAQAGRLGRRLRRRRSGCWAAVWDEEGEQACVRFRIENFQKLVVDEGRGGRARYSGFWVDDWVSGVPALSDPS